MFECVNESDEKGDGSDKVGYVARVGGDIDVHGAYSLALSA
ncbi:hypothetical protein ACRPHP_07020 [Pantoea allii]